MSKCEKARSANGANRSSVLLRHEFLGPRLVRARKPRPAPEVGDFAKPLAFSLVQALPIYRFQTFLPFLSEPEVGEFLPCTGRAERVGSTDQAVQPAELFA